MKRQQGLRNLLQKIEKEYCFLYFLSKVDGFEKSRKTG
jgi:hypothetical protein